MSLNKKNSRVITVDDRSYRWTVFENSGWTDFTIQKAEGTGQKLVVQLPWPTHDGPTNCPGPIITPGLVRNLIDKACDEL